MPSAKPSDRGRKSNSEAGEGERQAEAKERKETTSDTLLAGTNVSLRTLTSPLAFICYHDSTIDKRMSFIGRVHKLKFDAIHRLISVKLQFDHLHQIDVIIERGSCLCRHVSRIDEVLTNGELFLLQGVLRWPETDASTSTPTNQEMITVKSPPALVFDKKSTYNNISMECHGTNFADIEEANETLDEAIYPSSPEIVFESERASSDPRSMVPSTSLGDNTAVKVKTGSDNSI